MDDTEWNKIKAMIESNDLEMATLGFIIGAQDCVRFRCVIKNANLNQAICWPHRRLYIIFRCNLFSVGETSDRYVTSIDPNMTWAGSVVIDMREKEIKIHEENKLG